MTNVQRAVDLACAIALLTLVVFGDAILEWLDPGRIDRRIEHVEQQAEPVERSSWADHPNDSKCGWACIQRIPTTGESWGD